MINKNVIKEDNINLVTFDYALGLVKNEVNKALSTSPKIIRGYTEHLTLSSGKYIRAIALLTCAENKEGLIHINAVKFAASIELLHLATLVHDDVIDNAKTRRGVITLQKKYGKRTAVICGDYLFCLALKISSEIINKENYLKFDVSDYIGRVCLGELNQHINNYNFDLSVLKYFKIISGKTAALFEASFYAGAIHSTNDNNEINKYLKLGRYIGMIFQLTDDCIDFESTQEKAKKPVQSDFEQGVITLPLIYAFENNSEFKEKSMTEEITRDEINQTVKETGGLDFTKLVSKKYYDKSLKIINELNLSDNKRSKLLSILDKAYYGLKK